MNDNKGQHEQNGQNEQEELRDLDVPAEQADGVRGGYTHVLEDAIIVSRKPT